MLAGELILFEIRLSTLPIVEADPGCVVIFPGHLLLLKVSLWPTLPLLNPFERPPEVTQTTPPVAYPPPTSTTIPVFNSVQRLPFRPPLKHGDQIRVPIFRMLFKKSSRIGVVWLRGNPGRRMLRCWVRPGRLGKSCRELTVSSTTEVPRHRFRLPSLLEKPPKKVTVSECMRSSSSRRGDFSWTR